MKTDYIKLGLVVAVLVAACFFIFQIRGCVRDMGDKEKSDYEKTIDSLKQEKARISDSLKVLQGKYCDLEKQDSIKSLTIKNQKYSYDLLKKKYNEKINAVNFLNPDDLIRFFTDRLAQEDSISAADSATFFRYGSGNIPITSPDIK